ncbi:MAG: rhodanese-like domain-containing protein [Nanoarchaeota archaeon]|nr:rhodanese-like domain-containing protein [Nanoarchaeota archaeon]
MKTISAEELKEKIDAEEDFVLVNVLSKESYEARHVPTSINIPVDEVENRAPTELPDKNKEIIVYCASTTCQASPRAAKKLEELGYINVTDYETGVVGWQDAGYPFTDGSDKKVKKGCSCCQ